MNEEALERINSLTKNEFTILRLTVAGYNTDEICEQIKVTKNTVQTQLSNIYSKIPLRQNNKVNLVLWYLKNILDFEINYKEG